MCHNQTHWLPAQNSLPLCLVLEPCLLEGKSQLATEKEMQVYWERGPPPQVTPRWPENGTESIDNSITNQFPKFATAVRRLLLASK